jgi:hypothetical protein
MHTLITVFAAPATATVPAAANAPAAANVIVIIVSIINIIVDNVYSRLAAVS